jgi:hypothetical protein
MSEENFSFPVNDGYEPIEETTNEEVTENSSEETTESENTEKVKETEEQTEETKGEEQEGAEEAEGVSGEAKGDVVEAKDTEEGEVETVSEDKESTDRSLNDISEMTEGKYNSIEEMYEAIQSKDNLMSTSSVIEQMNEQIEDKFGEGISMSDIVSYQSLDFDEMDPFDVLTEHLQFKDPDITEKGIRAELRQFKLLQKSKQEIDEMIEDGDITLDDYEDAEAALERKVRIARRELKDFQDEINIDDLEVYAPQQQQQAQQKSEEELIKDAEYYDSVINSYTSKGIEVGTKENPHSLNLETTDDDRNGIREFLSDGDDGTSWINKRWMMEDGRVNMDKLSDDINKIMNYEKHLKIAFTQGKSAGASKEVKDISNIDFSDGKNKPKSDEGLSQLAQIANEIN